MDHHDAGRGLDRGDILLADVAGAMTAHASGGTRGGTRQSRSAEGTIGLTVYRYKEKFEKDKGFRLFRDKRSVLVHAHSYGRRLTDEQLSSYVKHINRYLDAIAGRPELEYGHTTALSKADFPQLEAAAFYKFVSDQTREYLKEGSIQLGTAEYYRAVENENIRDQREGTATFHLASEDNQWNVSLTSGFNCAIFCGTSRYDDDDFVMASRFGRRLIKIDPVDEFIGQVCKLSGAYTGHVYDVIYTDLKNYSAEMKGVEKVREILGVGNLTPETLHQLNEMFFETLYDFAFMPSLFSKPKSYEVEKERRIIFETRDDLRKQNIVLKDRSLQKFIHFMD